MHDITYVGPFPAVDLPVFDDATVAHGETVSIEDVDVARSLLDQPSNWQPANDAAQALLPAPPADEAPAKKAPAKKAAKTTDSTAQEG